MLYISLAYYASPTREPSSCQSAPTLLRECDEGLTKKSVAKVRISEQKAKFYLDFFEMQPGKLLPYRQIFLHFYSKFTKN